MQSVISLLPLISSANCFMASPLNATQGLLREAGKQSHRHNTHTFNDLGTFLDFSANPEEDVIPKISEAFKKYDTFGTMGYSAWNTRIGLDFLMNEAQWNYDRNDQFKAKNCGYVMRGL